MNSKEARATEVESAGKVSTRDSRQMMGARSFRALKAIVRTLAYVLSEFGSHWKVSRGMT